MMLPNWDDRPVTVANLLNPAFCGEILKRCGVGYAKTHVRNQYLPFQLSFLTLPLILHKRTRDALPKKSNRSLIDWIENNQAIKWQIPSLVKALVPCTREAVMFLMVHKNISLNENGEIEILIKPKQLNGELEDEIQDCYKKAELVGRWFATAGNFQTIYISFGIKP